MLQLVDHKENGLTPSIEVPKQRCLGSLLKLGHCSSMCCHASESASVCKTPSLDLEVLCHVINFAIWGHLNMWDTHGMIRKCVNTLAGIVVPIRSCQYRLA